MVLKVSAGAGIRFAYRGLTSCARPSQTVRLRTRFLRSLGYPRSPCQPSLPPHSIGPGPLSCTGLGSSPFARHYSGNDLFSSGYLDVSVPPVPPARPMCSAAGTQAFPWVGSPIRVSPALTLEAAPRSFSQLSTPFFGSWRQGIHRVPLVA